MRLADRRGAVTLLEVLVCLAIIFTLIALLLPAVQAARGAADRLTCLSRLRTLGQALHGFESRTGSWPRGQSPPGAGAVPVYATWMVHLLPDIEQTPLWEISRADHAARPLTAGVGSFASHRALAVVLPALLCPLDDRLVTPQIPVNVAYPVAFTSYLGVSGAESRRADGVLHSFGAVRPAGVRDGLSNTLAVGERPPSADLRFGWWYTGIGIDYRGTADAILGAAEVQTSYPSCPTGVPAAYGPGEFDRQCDMLHYWSPHAGGSHFLLADGSARLIAYSAGERLRALATRAGGEAVSAD